MMSKEVGGLVEPPSARTSRRGRTHLTRLCAVPTTARCTFRPAFTEQVSAARTIKSPHAHLLRRPRDAYEPLPAAPGLILRRRAAEVKLQRSEMPTLGRWPRHQIFEPSGRLCRPSAEVRSDRKLRIIEHYQLQLLESFSDRESFLRDRKSVV